MTRQTTKEKQKIVIKAFRKLIESGKDYSARSMYEEAGKAAYLAPKSAGNIIRKYYRNRLTDDMKLFVSGLSNIQHESKVEQFAERFKVCTRESRLMIRYIKCRSRVEAIL